MKKSLIFSLGLGFLAACSSDEPGPKKLTDNSLRTEASFCQSWAAAACNADVIGNCDETSESACVDRQAAFCEDLVPSGYSSTHAADCIEAVEDAYEDAVLDAEELDTVRNLGGDCAYLVDGGYREGETCDETTKCNTVDGYACVIKPGDVTGTCQIPNFRGPANSCAAAEDICDSGTYCDDGNHCVDPEPTGTACTHDGMCSADDYCQVPAGSTDDIGECTPRLENKAACMRHEECQSGLCLDATGKCTSNVVLTGESSLCLDL